MGRLPAQNGQRQQRQQRQQQRQEQQQQLPYQYQYPQWSRGGQRGKVLALVLGWGLPGGLMLALGAGAEGCSFPGYYVEQGAGGSRASAGAAGFGGGSGAGFGSGSGAGDQGGAGAAGEGGTEGGAGSDGAGGEGGTAGPGASTGSGGGGRGGKGGSGGAAPEPEVCGDLTFIPEGCTCVDGTLGELGDLGPEAVGDAHAYLFCGSVTRSWVTASLECASVGLRLVRVDSVQEDSWLEVQAAASGVEYFWLGASSRDEPGTWTWDDGEAFWKGDQSGDPLGELYSQWHQSSPGDASAEYCAYKGVDGWEHRPCTEAREYVCELY